MHDGIQVTRRSVLPVLAGFVGLTVGDTAKAWSRAVAGGLTFEEFLAQANPVATELVTDTSARGQEIYLHRLASIAVQLGDVAVPELRASGQGDNVFIGANRGGNPFLVLHWRMEPGSVIRPHAHTYGNVVTVGLEGEARVKNYEVVGERDYDATEPFDVRCTRDQVLKPGGINLVSLERDYIHGFEAGPEGARGLDITTRVREKRATPYLELGEEVEEGLFEATWTG